jgi:type IV pilus biogenesis protein CpaD/CtpE
MTLESRYPGTCKHCGVGWKVGDQIHYSKDPKITCTSQECFETQKANAPASGRESSYNKTITTVRPDVEVPAPMKEALEKVVQALAASHDVVKILYPDLNENTHTFGQIRSKLVDQLFAAYSLKVK